jgi:acyl-CoA synthetase (AMP-forming)/AMP-acid ligase II
MAASEPWSYHPDGSPVYSLADIIRKRASATPTAIALAEAGRVTSFAELDRRSSQVARALQAGGVRPGDRVAFIGASGPEFVEVLYGAAKARAIFTAVNNRLAAREVLGILADAEPRVPIVDQAAAPWSPTSGASASTAMSWSPTTATSPGGTPLRSPIPATWRTRTRPRSSCTPRAPPGHPRASSSPAAIWAAPCTNCTRASGSTRIRSARRPSRSSTSPDSACCWPPT